LTSTSGNDVLTSSPWSLVACSPPDRSCAVLSGRPSSESAHPKPDPLPSLSFLAHQRFFFSLSEAIQTIKTVFKCTFPLILTSLRFSPNGLLLFRRLDDTHGGYGSLRAFIFFMKSDPSLLVIFDAWRPSFFGHLGFLPSFSMNARSAS